MPAFVFCDFAFHVIVLIWLVSIRLALIWFVLLVVAGVVFVKKKKKKICLGAYRYFAIKACCILSSLKTKCNRLNFLF